MSDRTPIVVFSSVTPIAEEFVIHVEQTDGACFLASPCFGAEPLVLTEGRRLTISIKLSHDKQHITITGTF